MTYIADLDPENAVRRAAREDANRHIWDMLEPDWEEKSIDPEQRVYVPQNWVSDPHAFIVRGYGGDHRYIASPGAEDIDF